MKSIVSIQDIGDESRVSYFDELRKHGGVLEDNFIVPTQINNDSCP